VRQSLDRNAGPLPLRSLSSPGPDQSGVVLDFDHGSHVVSSNDNKARIIVIFDWARF
jgi:hypothetical protein